MSKQTNDVFYDVNPAMACCRCGSRLFFCSARRGRH